MFPLNPDCCWKTDKECFKEEDPRWGKVPGQETCQIAAIELMLREVGRDHWEKQILILPIWED